MSRSIKAGETKTTEHSLIVLVGQPNSGKSTIFNHVAGYRAISSNFPCTTVNYTESHIRIRDKVFDLVDLPGIYSITALDEAASETQKYLLENPLDAVINVVDSSILGRSLELTLELTELGIPLVLCLNMMDEARRKGVTIDVEGLSVKLGIPVVSSIARTGEGLQDLFDTAYRVASEGLEVHSINLSRDVDRIVNRVVDHLVTTGDISYSLGKYGNKTNFGRFQALKLLEGDPYFENSILSGRPEITRAVESARKELERSHGRPADMVISSERHSQALNLFEAVARVESPGINWRDRLDNFLLHSAWGYLFLALFLWGFFNLVFNLGRFIEVPMLARFDDLIDWIGQFTGEGTFLHILIEGLMQGLSAGIGIVLPFLVPFFLGLAVIEDVGYLPRISYLLDTFMHRIGLHGVAAIPIALGYGCSVPAVMATRILANKRERFIASMIAVLVPCSARIVVILGLAGAYLGANWALIIFITNLLILSILGHILSRIMPAVSPGLILEIPSFKPISLRAVIAKTWLRLREFIIIAWPLLVIGSIILTLLQYFGFETIIARILSPFTGLLGLPQEVGLTLIFGILRKELILLMLSQALGVTDIHNALTLGQIMVLTVFVVYYIPCVATLGVFWRGVGAKRTLIACLISITMAMGLALLARLMVFVIV